MIYDWSLFIFSPTDKWSPALQIRTVLLSIQALLSAPNPDDPLANDVAEQWKENEVKAIETGKTQVCSLSLMLWIVSNTKKSVSSDIQTLSSGKKPGAAEFFNQLGRV